MAKFSIVLHGAASVALLVLAACGGDGSPAATTTPSAQTDTTPPTIAGVRIVNSGASLNVPADGAKDVPISGTQIVYTMSEPINCSAAPAWVTGSIDEAAPIACSSPNLTLSSLGDLYPGFTYTITLPAVPDHAGNRSAIHSLTFTAAFLRYTDKVIALWTDGSPFMVTRSGVTKVVMRDWPNWQAGFCALPGRPEANGHVLVLCREFVNHPVGRFFGKWLVFAIDPVKGEMAQFWGTFRPDALRPELAFTQTPAGGVEVPANSEWTWVQKLDSAYPDWAANAQVSDGWYYTPNDATSQLYFRDSSGNVVVVKSGTLQTDGSVALLRSFSN